MRLQPATSQASSPLHLHTHILTHARAHAHTHVRLVLPPYCAHSPSYPQRAELLVAAGVRGAGHPASASGEASSDVGMRLGSAGSGRHIQAEEDGASGIAGGEGDGGIGGGPWEGGGGGHTAASAGQVGGAAGRDTHAASESEAPVGRYLRREGGGSPGSRFAAEIERAAGDEVRQSQTACKAMRMHMPLAASCVSLVRTRVRVPAHTCACVLGGPVAPPTPRVRCVRAFAVRLPLPPSPSSLVGLDKKAQRRCA